MCIVALAWQLFESMPVVLLSNRDEFLNRPTLSAYQWQDEPIFAGRDDKSGGTWLGHHQMPNQQTFSHQSTSHQTSDYQKIMEHVQNGRWAAVLNFRDGVQSTPEQCSRGELVTQFLSSSLSPLAYARQIDLRAYAGFNLIVGDTRQAVVVNNRGYPPTPLPAGLHIFSNGQPESDWFKCERLRGRVRQEVLPLIAENSNIEYWQQAAFMVLSDTTPAPGHQLPTTTGMPVALEQALSAICIKDSTLPNYGTRTQSILTVSRANDDLTSDLTGNLENKFTTYRADLISREL